MLKKSESYEVKGKGERKRTMIVAAAATLLAICRDTGNFDGDETFDGDAALAKAMRPPHSETNQSTGGIKTDQTRCLK